MNQNNAKITENTVKPALDRNTPKEVERQTQFGAVPDVAIVSDVTTMPDIRTIPAIGILPEAKVVPQTTHTIEFQVPKVPSRIRRVKAKATADIEATPDVNGKNGQHYETKNVNLICTICLQKFRTKKTFAAHAKTHPNPSENDPETYCVDLKVNSGGLKRKRITRRQNVATILPAAT